MKGETGTMMDRRLAATFVELSRARRSGIVTAMRGRLKRLFCLREGRIVYGASNVIEEQLEQVLVDSGRLEPGARLGAVKAAAVSGRSPLAELVEAGVLDEPTLRASMAEYILRLGSDALGWRDGEHLFEPGSPKLDDQPLAEVSTAALLVSHARALRLTAAGLRSRLGPPGLKPVLDEGFGQLPADVARDELIDFLLAECDGTRSVDLLIARSPAGADATLRALYGLLLSGVVIPSKQAEAAKRGEAGVTRDELLARFKRAEGADCYSLLEQNVSATFDDVREAYYFLARRYHPDRFRTGALSSYLPQVEQFFARVTEAYNTLSDSERRAAYDRERQSTVAEPQAEAQEQKQDAGFLAKENYARARVLMNRGRFADALQFLENAVQLDAKQALYHLELGRVKARNPRLREEALAHLAHANRLDPARVEAYLERARLYKKLDDLPNAAAMYREVLRWEPGHLEAGEELAELGKAAGSGGLRGLFRG